VAVAHTREVTAVVSAQVVDKVALGDPLGVSKLLVVEVEVHPFIDDVVHGAHRHLRHAL